MRRPVAIALVLVLASTALVAPLAGAQASGGNETAVTNESNETANAPAYSLETLRNGGKTVPGADPSTRWLANGGSVFVDYSSGNPLMSGGTEDWEVENVLANGNLVRTNKLTFRANRMRGAEPANLELVVVYWSEESVQRGNQTVTRARVDAEERKSLTFEGAFDRSTVRLQRSDDTRRVTMWLQNAETGERIDGAAWTFRHNSVATSASSGIETMGDYLAKAFVEFLVPIAIGAFVAGILVSKAVKRAGVGPQYGFFPWIAALTVGTILFTLFQYGTLADLLVDAPTIAAVYMTALVGIVILESQQENITETLFLRPHLVDVANPRGEDAVDSMLGDATEEKVVKLSGGREAVVRPGLLPFLSRVWGGAAILEPTRPLTTEMQLAQSDWDQVIFVDPDADETLDYTPEGWAIAVPSVESWTDVAELVAFVTVLAGIVLLVGMKLSWLWAIGAGVALLVGFLATPTETSAIVEPASGHERAAFVSMMYLAIEHDDAETIESARQKLIEERAHQERDVDDALEMQDATLIEEMLGSDVDRRLVDGPSSTDTGSSSATSSSTSAEESEDRDRGGDEIREVTPADD